MHNWCIGDLEKIEKGLGVAASHDYSNLYHKLAQRRV